jgi:hypothetical protein
MPTIDPTEMSQAYEKALPVLRAIPAEHVRKPRLDLNAAAGLVLAAYPKLEPLLGALAKLDTVAPALVNELRERTLVLMRANAIYASTLREEPTVTALLGEAVSVRRDLLNACDFLVQRGALGADFVAKVRAGSGYKDLSDDVTVLGNLFDREWARFEEDTPPSVKRLAARAMVLGPELTVALGEGRIDASAPAALDLRDRAYTAFLEAYEEVRAALAFLRRKEGDADQILPSVFADRGGKARGRDTSPEPVPAPGPAPSPPDAGGAIHDGAEPGGPVAPQPS